MFKRWLQQTTMATMVALAPLPVMAEETPKQGGAIVVTYKDDITTLDPAIGYDWVNWSMIKSLYSRLMDYAPGTPNPVPSLAESFTVSPDGLTYTFKLHKGVKFSNGREVVASDVKYSIERAVDPKTQGPGAGFFGAIKGFEDETGGKTTTLAGIETPDDSTVIFNLSRPDATFLHVLAINFASVVPKEAVEAAAGDFGKKPVGSGTFILKDWTIGQQLVFERNKDYFVKGVPYIDSFKVEVGQEPLVALLRLQKGEVDIAGDGIPPAKFLEIKNSADGAQMIVDGEQLHTGYITLNTKVEPFDNVKVRQALNMAINKERITRILNGRATPANQPLPPLMPGYDKSFTGYAYDVAKAKALLAEAGYPRWLRDRALLHQHRSAAAYRPGDPAGSGRRWRQGRSPGAGPGKRHLGRRHRRRSADDLVGRHGLDRRLPGSVQLLRPDPRLRRRGSGRLELVMVLQCRSRQARRCRRLHVRSGKGDRAHRRLGQDLYRHHGRCAVDPCHQRTPRRRQVAAHGRR
ncbi:ABC-type transport system substrate-binding protein [Rhizobium leguminosarum]